NRPLAFNLPGLNVILQFKLYMQGMYVLFARHAVMAMRGATPEERRQGRRTFAYLMATHAAVAGAAGLGLIAWMAKLGLLAFAAISDDEDDDWKSGSQLMREMLQDLFGEYGGVVAEKGLPAILGVDMSDRLGLPVPFDSRYANIRQDDSPGTTLDKVVLYSLGAPYANLKRIATLPFADSQNELISSLPTALRQVVRSAVWAREGVV
ncbi:hypothetical protein LPQ06_28450, partial [Klebsiella pneumoniae]|nr:hypothetical protein [Klebsiella pneumoniae]